MRISAVLDAHVVARGIAHLRSSAAVRVFDLALQGDFVAVTSRRIIIDIEKATANIFVAKYRDVSLADAIKRAVPVVQDATKNFVVSPGRLASTRSLIEGDPDDTVLVEAALEVGCQYIVTDDKAVLHEKVIIVKGYEPIQIVPPQIFLRMV